MGTASGAPLARQTYYAYGAPRTTEGTLPTDYTFTGQRADASAGLMYYNARYYDAGLGRFIQPDTIVPDQYNPQSLNRYAYVLNNPVKYTDPTGHRPCIDFDENGKCIPEPFLPPSPKVPDAPPGGDPATPWDVGWEWLMGRGPRHHEFREGDPFTELLRDHYWIAVTKEKIKTKLTQHNYSPGENDYDLSGLEGIPKYIQDYSNILTFGHTGNLAATYLGSYDLDYFIVSVDPSTGTAQVLFHVWNESTLASATHPPVIGYTELWNNTVTPLANWVASAGPGLMQPTTQHFWWTETIKFK